MADCGTEDLPIFINKTIVQKILKYDLLIPAMEKALKNFSLPTSNLQVVQPLRSVVEVSESNGFLLTMPAYNPADKALATKLVTLFPNNQPPLSSHHACVVLFCPDSGRILAILDGEVLTARRTAATSAAATKALADVEKSKILAIVGSGVQAESHIRAHLVALFAFTEVRIASRNRSKLEHLASQLSDCCGDDVSGPRLVISDSTEAAVRGADVICTVTSSREPVVCVDWVKKGAHINCVGACRPDWQELDPELMRTGEVFVDSRVSAQAESGDVILSGCHVSAELGEVIGGTHERPAPDMTTIFKSMGLAVEDAVAAKLVYDRFSAT